MKNLKTLKFIIENLNLFDCLCMCFHKVSLREINPLKYLKQTMFYVETLNKNFYGED